MQEQPIECLLRSYPRTRPELSAAHQRLYAAEYKANREGTNVVEGLAKKLEAWMHRRVAEVSGSPTLELGAGTLNHLAFEEPQSAYDVVEPFVELFKDSPRLASVRNVYGSQDDVPPDQSYARIISIAVLEHMTNLPRELALSCRLLATDGVFVAGIPSEGGALWGMAWRSTTGVAYYLRNRLPYGPLMRHEHVNKASEIETLVRYYFRDVKVRRFPTPLHHLSFYTFLEARHPQMERAQETLEAALQPGASPKS